jgi:hypothetical protein
MSAEMRLMLIRVVNRHLSLDQRNNDLDFTFPVGHFDICHTGMLDKYCIADYYLSSECGWMPLEYCFLQ